MRRFDSKGQAQFLDPRLEKLRFFGGTWCTKRKFRVARPLSTKAPIHLILKSTQAKGRLSFSTPTNRKLILALLMKTSRKWGVQVIQFANVGNHLHLMIKLGNLRTYKPFICALTGGIPRHLKWRGGKFWNYRPFTRVVQGLRALLTLRDYLVVNQLEGGGVHRSLAVILVRNGQVMADSS